MSSLDLVKVGIRADIFYSISDPEKWTLKIDTDEVRLSHLQSLLQHIVFRSIFHKAVACISLPINLYLIISLQLEDLVRETAIATLTNIIRSTALNQIAQSKNISAGSSAGPIGNVSPGSANYSKGAYPPAVTPVTPINDSGEAPPPSAPMSEFFDKTHDEFMSKVCCA